MRDVVILGSTGSIGTQALEVVAEHPGEFRVVGLAAGGGQIELLARQVLDTSPRVVGVTKATAVQDLQLALYAEASRRSWSSGEFSLPRIVAGPDAAAEVARTPCDVVLNAITGSAGLAPTLATLAAGTTLALANKESLVVGGRLVTSAAAPGQLVAVDVTPEQALAHPTWNMGRVITTNSATLVNKGLELLEAGLLYGVDLDRIDVVVHPQSMVHSMVQFVDGSTLAQCSPPDMKLPIALGLGWPHRIAGAARAVDWTTASTWTFEPLDRRAFPAVELARRAGRLGGTAPAVYNAANEECVDAFHDGRIAFLDILDVVAAVVEEHVREAVTPPDVGSRLVVSADLDVPTVLAADAWARGRARAINSSNVRTESAG